MVHTLWMSCGAGVSAPHYSRFVLEDSLGFKRDPVTTERAVVRSEFDRIQQLKFLDERATGTGLEFGQLFFLLVLDRQNECPLMRRGSCD